MNKIYKGVFPIARPFNDDAPLMPKARNASSIA